MVDMVIILPVSNDPLVKDKCRLKKFNAIAIFFVPMMYLIEYIYYIAYMDPSRTNLIDKRKALKLWTPREKASLKQVLLKSRAKGLIMTDQSPIPGQISSSEADELENEILSELNENKPSETEDVKEAESEVEDSLSLSEEQPTISVVPVELQNEEWDSKTNEEEEEKEDDEEEDLEDVIELDRPPSPTKSVLYPPVPEYVPPTQQFHQYPQQQQCQYQYQQQQPMGKLYLKSLSTYKRKCFCLKRFVNITSLKG